jgi:hypothetical protein
MDTLSPANYFEPRDDCAMPCPIAAGIDVPEPRHHPDCAIVADTGHAYREAVAVEAERLRTPADAVVSAWILTAGAYADTEVVGYFEGTHAEAHALAGKLTAARANPALRISRDLIAVAPEQTTRFNADGSAAR